MRVNYRLSSKNLSGVPGEAAWAESIGYDGVSSSETAHDPFLPLAMAATSTSRVILATSVAIAFPVHRWLRPTLAGICRTFPKAVSDWVWEPR